MIPPMKSFPPLFLLFLSLACSTAALQHSHYTQPTPKPDPLSLQSLHVRLTLRPTDGGVSYFGWYDGKRNLLGPAGIGQALIGMEPPELKGEAKKISDTELLYQGIDQNQFAWVKRYRLEENTVHVTIKVTNKRDQASDVIIYSLSDLPDATITGNPRDQLISAPIASAHFHADIDSATFPGESMTPYALRSDQHHLEPGESMEFHMTWELALPRK
jgi:hypothetical protein